AGRVVSIGFDAGETVAAEQQLLQLYDAPEQADRAAALARVKLADAQLKRAARLVNSGAESREILDQRTAERDQALAAVKQLDARIAQKQIRAPFAGQLGIRQVDLGQYLNPGETIATLTDTSQLYVDFTVPQQELRWVQQGGKVQVVSDAWPDNSYTATVTTVEPRISADTRNIQIRAQLDNPGEHLRPGMFVNASLSLPEQKEQLVVPSTAIQTTAFGSNVLLVRGAEPEKAGQAEYVQVQISRRLKDQVVISSGLKVGDIVVTEGQLKVPPGAPVTVTKLRAAEES
ncbi:efflux RND transporter periplasmic adaptor subunit, partial [Spongiibacter sp. UBA6593]